MKKKLLALILSVAVVASIAAAGTLAYLTSTSETVENVFTMGKIDIELWEHELQEDGSLDMDKVVTENEYNRILPGMQMNKDPFVTVKANSEDCYLYAFVYNGLNAAVPGAAELNVDTSVWEQIDWTYNITLYRLKNIVSSTAADVPFTVFDVVSMNPDLTAEDMATINDADARIVIGAYAHQASTGLEDIDVAVADEAAKEILSSWSTQQ